MAWLQQQKAAAGITSDAVYVQARCLRCAAACAAAVPVVHTLLLGWHIGPVALRSHPPAPCLCPHPTRLLLCPPALPAAGPARRHQCATSGVGSPSWQQLVDDLPELGSVRTKLTDGAGL